ncbi:uncharacterized protein GIQ15_01885 [Arthroderma uncinatum]|uniref:uncharacterized protein n=1 Tax=Arthroderma uncinatum TaxID=74035 RepID=UPI00144A590E|nr:uncharacterized protein GIQ15_01885 [Arthroderma uncinatum]KAF3492368.1 hypothetical protein GIQ15_01885 [Arthroderma uncinatum]
MPIYDNKAYTISSTYQDGQLKLYTVYPTAPRESDGRPEYIMSQLKGWSMTSDSETFRKGTIAYRNARDWAKEQRDKFIEAAIERHIQGQSEVPTAAEREVTPEPIITLEASDIATADEAAFHDAAQDSNKRIERARNSASGASKTPPN